MNTFGLVEGSGIGQRLSPVDGKTIAGARAHRNRDLPIAGRFPVQTVSGFRQYQHDLFGARRPDDEFSSAVFIPGAYFLEEGFHGEEETKQMPWPMSNIFPRLFLFLLLFTEVAAQQKIVLDGFEVVT